MTTTTSTTIFRINFIEKKIIGTKAAINKAGKGFGPEYEELSAKMAAHPNFELVVKEPKHKSNKAKQTYNGLDFNFMESFIGIQTNAKQLRKEYDAVKKMAVDSNIKVYPITKKWFLNTFNADGEFDMDEAREAISDYRIKTAVDGVAKENKDEAKNTETLGLVKSNDAA